MFFTYYIGVSNDEIVVFPYSIGVLNGEIVVFHVIFAFRMTILLFVSNYFIGTYGSVRLSITTEVQQLSTPFVKQSTFSYPVFKGFKVGMKIGYENGV